MKKLITSTIVFMALIALLFQFACVQASSSQTDEGSNMSGQANESITFFDSNDVNDVNDISDPNRPIGNE